MTARTHDLRGNGTSFVPQADPDGRTTIIRMSINRRQILPDDFVIVGGSTWSGRYRVLGVTLSSGGDHLRCEQASRTLAEVDADRSREATRRVSSTMMRAPA